MERGGGGRRGVWTAARNLALALGSLAVLLGALEIAARLALPPRGDANTSFVPRSIIEETGWEELPHRNRPGSRGTQHFGSDPAGYFDPGATLRYRINSLGLRGPETTREKPPGVERILGLGDSFTFGTGVRLEDTWLAVLGRALAASGRTDVEVLNGGVAGYDTTHELALLERFGLALGPDLVLLCFFLNDTGVGNTLSVFNLEPDGAARPLWRRESRLLDALALRVERRRAAETLVAAYRSGFADDHPGWRASRAALLRLARLSQRHGFRLAIVVFPVLWRLSGGYPFAEAHATVVAYADSIGVPALDLQPAFAGYDGPELWVHPANQHPNREAHAVAGRAVHAFLAAHPRLLPPSPAAGGYHGADGEERP